MSEETDGPSKDELREDLLETRSKVRELEDELAKTNEGMIALTIELEHAKARYETIFEESSDAVLLIDPDRDAIREANSRACDLFGYDRDALVALSASDVFPAEGDEFWSFVEAVVEGWGASVSCRTKDGRHLDVDVSASMVSLDGDSYLLASIRDVTRRKRREQRLQVLNRISRHNLRNEGNVIQGRADLLSDELSDTEYEHHALAIQRTIDGILERSGKLRRVQDLLDRQRIYPVSLTDVFETQRETIERRNPAATVTYDPPTKEVTTGERLGLALHEAIENACVHNEPETTVRVSATRPPGDEGVQVEVRDDGHGIPEHERQTMRLGEETPLTHGNGTGLWIVRWIVDSLGGKLTLKDAEPRGTVVSMTLPVEPPRDDRVQLPRPSRSSDR